MLELRFIADARRIAAMRDSIARECSRLNVGAEHSETVAFVAEHLVGGGEKTHRAGGTGARRSKVLVIVTVQSDATMLMVREAAPVPAELGDARQLLLEAYASRWSTMSGADGRTVWAEIARSRGLTRDAPAPTGVPAVAAVD